MNFSAFFYSTLLCLSQIYQNEKLDFSKVYQNEIPSSCKEIRSAYKVIQNFKKTFNYSHDAIRQYDDLLLEKYSLLNCKKECDDVLELVKNVITEVKSGKLAYQREFQNGNFDCDEALGDDSDPQYIERFLNAQVAGLDIPDYIISHPGARAKCSMPKTETGQTIVGCAQYSPVFKDELLKLRSELYYRKKLQSKVAEIQTRKSRMQDCLTSLDKYEQDPTDSNGKDLVKRC